MFASLFHRLTLGLAITDTQVRAGIAERSEGILTMRSTVAVDLPEGTVVHGAIHDAAQFTAALSKLVKTLPVPFPRRVALCLPPQVLYGCLLSLLAAPRIERARMVRASIAKMVPEPAESLVIASAPLQKSRTEVGVVCVRSDILQAYRSALASAGLTLVSVTSASHIIASLASASNGALIVQADENTITATAFLQGWPVDEFVLPVARKSALVEELESLLSSVKEAGHSVTRAVVVGEQIVRSAVQEACGAGVVVEPFKASSERQWEWLTVCGAAVGDPPWSVRLLTSGKILRFTRLKILFGILAALLLVDLWMLVR